MLQAAAAVEAAHEAGIIHRDLKPANIFVTQRADVPAIVKVLDFGIAKLAAETLDDDDEPNLTQVGAMIGTPRYMSPEQCAGLELTAAADVYSLGVILYEMLTGVAPFGGASPLAIAIKHAQDLPRPPREIVASIPADLERVVLHALEKRPEDRPDNAAEFRRELLSIADSLGLEHSAVTVLPDYEALRDAGVESPSGRLVIDIARLREAGVFSSSSNEITLVGNKKIEEVKPAPGPITRVNVTTPNHFSKILLAVILFIGALVLTGVGGVGYYALFSRRANSAVSNDANVKPSPVPTATPLPSPSPSPSQSPSPQRQASQKQDPNKKKKEHRNSVLNKVKRILTKPF
jgi:serine/threonine protein kinase